MFHFTDFKYINDTQFSIEDQNFYLKVIVNKNKVQEILPNYQKYEIKIIVWYSDWKYFDCRLFYNDETSAGQKYIDLINNFILPPILEDQIKNYFLEYKIFDNQKLIL